jgi:peptidoglycan/LPS O-acetylase OafA/YrhL
MSLEPNYRHYTKRISEFLATTLSPSKNRGYIAEIDQLRAMAAMLVLLYHGVQLFNPNVGITTTNPVLAIIVEGHSGVGLFIVLSGFILTLGAVGNSVSYKPFLIARILRIYPMLLVCLVVAINVGSSNLINVLTTVLPFNGAAVTGGIPGSFSAMFWAVAVEFQCYLIFPFLLMFSNERGSRFLFRVIAIAICLRLLATLTGDANPRDIGYWTIVGRIDQFCLGIIAARLYVTKGLQKIRPLWFLPAALAVAAMLWLFNQAGGFPSVSRWKIVWPDAEGAAWACFIVTYISAGRLLPGAISHLTSKLGEISYSFYLIHFAVINMVIKNSMALHATGHSNLDAIATTLFIVFPITAAIALLTYHTIELPFLRMRPKYVGARDGDGESEILRPIPRSDVQGKSRSTRLLASKQDHP